MKFSLLISVIFISLIAPFTAWSDEGHMLIATIARSLLLPEELDVIEKVLQAYPHSYTQFNDLVSASVWADQIKWDTENGRKQIDNIHLYDQFHYVNHPYNPRKIQIRGIARYYPLPETGGVHMLNSLFNHAFISSILDSTQEPTIWYYSSDPDSMFKNGPFVQVPPEDAVEIKRESSSKRVKPSSNKSSIVTRSKSTNSSAAHGSSTTSSNPVPQGTASVSWLKKVATKLSSRARKNKTSKEDSLKQTASKKRRVIRSKETESLEKPICPDTSSSSSLDTLVSSCQSASVASLNEEASVEVLKPTPLKNYTLESLSLRIRLLVHVLGDLHQPLHTTTLFSEKFPTGDEGGNLFLTNDPTFRNLHHFWDVCGGECTKNWHELSKDELEIKAKSLLEECHEDELLNGDSFEDVVEDSVDCATSLVYEFDPSKPIPQPFEITPSYKEQAVTLSRNRLCLAGKRVTLVLQDLAKALIESNYFE